jgi:hypothetical protein
MRRGAHVLILLALAILAGGTYLHAAPLSPALEATWTTTGTTTGEEWGRAVASAGDVSKDGYDDILVGVPKHDINGEKVGGVFLFLGGPGGLQTTPAWSATGPKGSEFGASVAGIGDVNCDTYPDIAVGAPLTKNDTITGGGDAGAVYVFYGTGTADLYGDAPNWSFMAHQGGAQLGYAIAGAGNVNHTGCDDLLVGAPYYTNGQTSEGALLLFYGTLPSGLGAVQNWTAEGNRTSATLGRSVAGLGDVDGDGHDDFAAGAPFLDPEVNAATVPDGGAAFVYVWDSDMGIPVVAPGWPVEGPYENANLGWSVGAAGDVNGDGFPDVVAGMPGYRDSDGLRIGAALLFHAAPAGPSPTPALTLTGEQALSNYGSAVAGAGDMNADGYGDLLVGANNFSSTSQEMRGAAYLYLGGPGGLSPTFAWRGEGEKADTGYGFAVATAGDVNRDGGKDFLVGAPQYRDKTRIVGAAYAYLGEEGNLFYTHFLPFVTTP